MIAAVAADILCIDYLVDNIFMTAISDVLCAYLCKCNWTGKPKLPALLAELQWNHKQHASHNSSATVTMNSNNHLLMMIQCQMATPSTLLFKHVRTNYDFKWNKLIFLYLKTRPCKYYILNIVILYIKLHKLSWIRN